MEEFRTILIEKTKNLYNSDEASAFWENREISRILHLETAIKQSSKGTSLKSYPDLYKSFPNRIELTRNSISIYYYKPDQSEKCYQIFEFLNKPRSKKEVYEILDAYQAKNTISRKYLENFIARISQKSLDGKFYLNSEVVSQKMDNLGFYICDIKDEPIIFHLGKNRREIIELIIYFSKYGLTKLLLEQVFLETNFCSDASLRRAISDLIKQRRIIRQKTTLYKGYKIIKYFHSLVMEQQLKNLSQGSWIFKIEKYRACSKHNSSIRDALISRINQISKKGYFWIPKIPKNMKYGYVSKSLLEISMPQEKIQENGLITQINTDTLDSKFLFFKIQTPVGFLIFTKEFASNPKFVTWLDDFIPLKMKQQSINQRNSQEAII
ncbi:MAG: hypothetical protein ACTSRG_25355 [Candidatus Helarchaeota archaeon]